MKMAVSPHFIIYRQLIYAAPEVYLDGPSGNLSNPKVDVWSLGIVLSEAALNRPLWSFLKMGQRIRKVLSLIQGTTPIFERIAREHNCYEIYQVTGFFQYLSQKFS